MSKRKFNILDVLKGLAILSVVLFHLGWFAYGYLGVDVFFVVAGYLSMGSLIRHNSDTPFSPAEFLFKRLVRLYPIALIAIVVVLLAGIFLFLPAELAGAARGAFFSNIGLYNIWQWRISADYWKTSNQYNPLMHYWYLCALIQVYALFALNFFRSKGRRQLVFRSCILGCLAMAGFILFIVNWPNNMAQYYFPHFRFFEFSIGAMLAWMPISIPEIGTNRISRWIAWFGTMSFSLYIWHQVLFAFVRYSTDWMETGGGAVFVFIAAVVLSAVSYECLENKMRAKQGIAIMIFATMIICATSVWLHFRNGIVCDVPELELYCNRNESVDHFGGYNERVRTLFDKPFMNDERLKVFVIGNSFGRDLVNVFAESSSASNIDVSYAACEKIPPDFNVRAKRADIILYATDVLGRSGDDGIIDAVKSLYDDVGLANSKVWLIGKKYLGRSMGCYYAKRWMSTYHKMTIAIPEEVRKENLEMAQKWGRHYVDLLSMMTLGWRDNELPMFTEDGKFVTFDCYHFSSFGCRHFGKTLPSAILSYCTYEDKETRLEDRL